MGDPLPRFGGDFVVRAGEGSGQEISVTLAGDCVLGGTEADNRQARGLTRTVLSQGLDYPFSGLLPLFSEDDLTLCNLEGVLSDSAKGRNPDKAFAFRGPASFAGILSQGSVEAVNLSNNHFDDYGAEGRSATLKALSSRGIAYAGAGFLCVYRLGDVKVGLMGMGGGLAKEKSLLAARQISLLREAGCAVVIASLHAGQEYAPRHSASQQAAARFLIDAGADLVAGHHPHVPQGVEIYNGRYIFYSLGNCVFGGNRAPSVTDALVARVVFSLEGGRVSGLRAALYPINFAGAKTGNRFRPVLLSGAKAEKALDRVRRDTPFPIPPPDPAGAAPLPAP